MGKCHAFELAARTEMWVCGAGMAFLLLFGLLDELHGAHIGTFNDDSGLHLFLEFCEIVDDLEENDAGHDHFRQGRAKIGIGRIGTGTRHED